MLSQGTFTPPLIITKLWWHKTCCPHCQTLSCLCCRFSKSWFLNIPFVTGKVFSFPLWLLLLLPASRKNIFSWAQIPISQTKIMWKKKNIKDTKAETAPKRGKKKALLWVVQLDLSYKAELNNWLAVEKLDGGKQWLKPTSEETLANKQLYFQGIAVNNSWADTSQCKDPPYSSVM